MFSVAGLRRSRLRRRRIQSSVAISPKGNFLFVANATEGTIAVFNINGNGVLAQAGLPFSVGAGATPTSIAVEHSGRFLYVTDPAHNAVRDSPFRRWGLPYQWLALCRGRNAARSGH